MTLRRPEAIRQEHTFDEPAKRGSFAAGWHLCFAVLTGCLDGHALAWVAAAAPTTTPDVRSTRPLPHKPSRPREEGSTKGCER
jgi:hypothetical protein